MNYTFLVPKRGTWLRAIKHLWIKLLKWHFLSTNFATTEGSKVYENNKRDKIHFPLKHHSGKKQSSIYIAWRKWSDVGYLHHVPSHDHEQKFFHICSGYTSDLGTWEDLFYPINNSMISVTNYTSFAAVGFGWFPAVFKKGLSHVQTYIESGRELGKWEVVWINLWTEWLYTGLSHSERQKIYQNKIIHTTEHAHS